MFDLNIRLFDVLDRTFRLSCENLKKCFPPNPVGKNPNSERPPASHRVSIFVDLQVDGDAQNDATADLQREKQEGMSGEREEHPIKHQENIIVMTER